MPIEEKEDDDVTSIKSVVGGSIGLAFMVVAVAVIIICRRNNISVCQCMVPGKLASKREITFLIFFYLRILIVLLQWF